MVLHEKTVQLEKPGETAHLANFTIVCYPGVYLRYFRKIKNLLRYLIYTRRFEQRYKKYEAGTVTTTLRLTVIIMLKRMLVEPFPEFLLIRI